MSKSILVTGGSGFFGSILVRELVEKGYQVTNIDLQKSDFQHPQFTSFQGDIVNTETMNQIFTSRKFDAIIHCAALLAHDVSDKNLLWRSNVEGTASVARMANQFQVPRVVFTSSNCLWGRGFNHPIAEEQQPEPAELYGNSKWEGEKILLNPLNKFHAVVIRCPTIIDSGRLGLLGILFEFIEENRKVWMVGKGENKYQFIYAKDLADACIRSIEHQATTIFNIGSNDVDSMRNVFQYVIDKSGSQSKIVALPKGPTLLSMKVAYGLGLSPLGPYHYKMIAENFEFNTNRIRKSLNWNPTLTNGEMLYRAFEYYQKNKLEILNRGEAFSAHKKTSKMGIIRILKHLS